MASLLQVEAVRAFRWRIAWTGINGVSALVPLAATPFVRPEFRPELVAGAAVSAVSALTTALWPLDVEGAAEQVRAPTLASHCARFQFARTLLTSAAADERARREWPWHLLNFGVSAALGSVVAFGFGRRTSGLVSSLSGFAAGEIQLFTQPAGLNADGPPLRVSFALTF